MRTKTIPKMNAAVPRLSDEDLDPLEKDDSNESNQTILESWALWDQQDIDDIKRLIENEMPLKQREIFEAFLDGMSHKELGVSEKYWRWHFTKGIDFIRKQLKI